MSTDYKSIRAAREHPAFKWVEQKDGAIPANAVQGGCESDGRPLFVSRQPIKNSKCVGKAAPHLGGSMAPFDGGEQFSSKYEILCGDASQLKWIEVKGRCVPDGWTPLLAGNDLNGEELYVSKYRLNDGGEVIGKVGPHMDNGCMFGYDCKEQCVPEGETYFVLGF